MPSNVRGQRSPVWGWLANSAPFSPVRHSSLLWELIKRDFLGRYKGSIAGVGWSLVNPLLMLAIYTFVFSVAFRARWGAANDSQVDFAIVLFSGLVVHSLFAECVNRAPILVVAHPNYVKKVVFPLDILPWMALGSAFFHFLISFSVLVIFCLLSGTTIHAGVALLPLILLPVILIILGLSWFLASLGVFLRDVSQVIGMLTTVALFLSPTFYPIDALPPPYRALLTWNPITLPIQNLRAAMLWGEPIDWVTWLISLFVAVVIYGVGLTWFQKTRKAFADVL